MRYAFILVLTFWSTQFYSQYRIDQKNGTKFQYGIASKLNIEFKINENPNFKLSITGGIGYNIENVFFPAVHTGIILFNKGTIGSHLNDSWTKIRAHYFYNAIGAIRLDKRNYSYFERQVPFYHFSDFTANPLQNPYKSSLSFGKIWINLPKNKRQQIGLFNANIVGRAQITYYNDGGFGLEILGDKRDRYYTGGILISYHGNERDDIDLIELSYHKFTGYVKHAFDIAEKLQMDFLIYADTSQFALNHQRWKLTVSDLSSGFSGNIAIYDSNSIDLQDFIHFKTNVPYHPDYFHKHRFAIGGRYEYNYLWLRK